MIIQTGQVKWLFRRVKWKHITTSETQSVRLSIWNSGRESALRIQSTLSIWQCAGLHREERVLSCHSRGHISAPWISLLPDVNLVLPKTIPFFIIGSKQARALVDQPLSLLRENSWSKSSQRLAAQSLPLSCLTFNCLASLVLKKPWKSSHCHFINV